MCKEKVIILAMLKRELRGRVVERVKGRKAVIQICVCINLTICLNTSKIAHRRTKLYIISIKGMKE